MSQNFEQTWNTYAASWRADTAVEKRELFKKCLDPACLYNDPLVKTKGWDELEAVMLDFHRQVLGGYFVTTFFQSHTNKSIARWDMYNGDHVALSDGISYGEYNDAGMLLSMTGFFEVPR